MGTRLLEVSCNAIMFCHRAIGAGDNMLTFVPDFWDVQGSVDESVSSSLFPSVLYAGMQSKKATEDKKTKYYWLSTIL